MAFILRLYFFIAAQMPKLHSQSYSNGPGNLGNLGSNKEIQPQFVNI